MAVQLPVLARSPVAGNSPSSRKGQRRSTSYGLFPSDQRGVPLKELLQLRDAHEEISQAFVLPWTPLRGIPLNVRRFFVVKMLNDILALFGRLKLDCRKFCAARLQGAMVLRQPGPTGLHVSTPGILRPLCLPEHFTRRDVAANEFARSHERRSSPEILSRFALFRFCRIPQDFRPTW